MLYQHLLVQKLTLAIKSPHHVRPLLLLYRRTYLIDAPTTTGQQPNPRKKLSSLNPKPSLSMDFAPCAKIKFLHPSPTSLPQP